MIGRTDEYEKMFTIEQRLWWYRILHETVARRLEQQFGPRRDVSILDAGCGTGGLLDFLRKRGYTDLRGIDGSADAVQFCHQRGLNVSLVNLNELADYEPEKVYEAIVSNDVFCYFNDPDLLRLVTELSCRLKPDGLLLSNNNAFGVFRGQHDLAIGSMRRFVRADFAQLLPQAGFRLHDSTYWSLALSPLILLTRQWQRLQLWLGWRSPDQPTSDVYLPHPLVNETLYRIVRAEQRLLPRTPFGSSLFIKASRQEKRE